MQDLTRLALWRKLGIDGQIDPALPRYRDAVDLGCVEEDVFGRRQVMTPATGHAWRAMTAAARRDGVGLLLVSAFRSMERQTAIFERKLKAGQSVQQILCVNMPPGCSEHHSGCALDLTTTDCEALSAGFEHTPAYAWLESNASRFDFRLSYPRNNPCGVDFEPWHWAFYPGLKNALNP